MNARHMPAHEIIQQYRQVAHAKKWTVVHCSSGAFHVALKKYIRDGRIIHGSPFVEVEKCRCNKVRGEWRVVESWTTEDGLSNRWVIDNDGTKTYHSIPALFDALDAYPPLYEEDSDAEANYDSRSDRSDEGSDGAADESDGGSDGREHKRACRGLV
jgi:hypothetical protein